MAAKEENKNLKFLALNQEQREMVINAREAVESLRVAIQDHRAKRSEDIQGFNKKNKKEYLEKHKRDLMSLQKDFDQKYLDLCSLEEDLGLNDWRRTQIRSHILK
jgi:ribosome recycling factor